MLLAELADQVDGIGAERSWEWLLRVTLTNFINGLKPADGSTPADAIREGFLDRLRRWRDGLPEEPARVHVDDLFNQLWGVIDAGMGDGHYLATGRIVASNLDRRAVIFVTERAVRAWLGSDAKGMANPHEVQAQCETLQARANHGDASVGLPARAVWLTPLTRPAADLVRVGRDLAARRVPADDDGYLKLATDIGRLLGFSQHRKRTCFVALITRRSIGDILDGGTPPPPIMGPSVLEGGTHHRWRHWAADYGRTYHLNSRDISAGVAEAIRQPLALDEIEEFLFMGAVNRPYRESHERFARALGADRDISDLLGELHALTGL